MYAYIPKYENQISCIIVYYKNPEILYLMFYDC